MISLNEILKDYEFCDLGIIRRIDSYLQTHVGPHRYEHTLLTLKQTLKLATQSHIEDRDQICKMLIAALAHDITKEEPVPFHHEIFLKNEVPHFVDIPAALYHAKSAPYFLAEHFGIDDPQIRHAIFYHSTGCDEMPVFSRIIFCADYMASRFKKDAVFGPSASLGEICFEKISGTIQYLVSKKMPVQHESINFYNILINELHHENETGKT